MFTRKSLKTAALLFCGACLLAILAASWAHIPPSARTLTWIGPYDAGESLLFALNKNFQNFWFPFFPVTIAVLQYHGPLWFREAACGYFFVLPVILSFSAAALIHSFPAGVLAAGASALLAHLIFKSGNIAYEQHLEQIMISSSMLMLVCGSSLKFRSYARKSLLIGLLLAMCLYTKGIIAPFVPLLLAYEAYWNKEGAPLAEQRPAMIAFLSAMALWSFVNLTSGNGFVFLEGATRAGNLIVTGALGFVASIEGDWRALAGIAPDRNIYVWAVIETLSHPLRFILAFFGRLRLMLFITPLLPRLYVLPALWLAGAFALRKLAAARVLMLLTSYLLLLHLLMPAESRFFVPVWFLMCPLIGIFLAEISVGRPADAKYESAGAKAVFVAAAAPALLFWAFSLAVLASFPLRCRLPHDLKKLEAAYPGSPWLHAMAARSALAAGDLDGAVEASYKAYKLENLRWRKTDYIGLVFIEGRLPAAKMQSYHDGFYDSEVQTLAALRFIEEGEPKKGGPLLENSIDACVVDHNDMRHIDTQRDRLVVEKLRAAGRLRCLSSISAALNMIDDDRRSGLIKALARVIPEFVYDPNIPPQEPFTRPSDRAKFSQGG